MKDHPFRFAGIKDAVPTADDKLRYERRLRLTRIIDGVAHAVVIVLSLALITFISYDTFANIPFLNSRLYMTFQFWVCVVFMADFVLELILSNDKRHYLLTHFFFFLISIPYLNIIILTDIQLGEQALYFIRFIPLVRGAYSLAMVVGYLSSNRALSLLSSYVAILASIIYFASLIFYEQEKPVNADVNTYWDALWWASMDVTTLGCYIEPMTVAGKLLGSLLAICGMLMLPLFTVFISSKVKAYNERNRQRQSLLSQAFQQAVSPQLSSGAPAATDTPPPSQK